MTRGAQLRVLAVDEIPENEENGVLYLIRKTVENLYPNQIQMSETGNGVTVTFVDKQFSVNGVCSPNDQWGWTRTFEMPLEPNKKYNVQFALKSGSFDNTGRAENGNNDILRVLMYGYKPVASEINLLNSTDILIDGRFEENKKDENILFRGSSNQRAINVKLSLENKKIIEYEF